MVDMGLHTADADLTRLAMGIELLRNVMAHPILRQYEAEEVLPGPSYGTREQLEDYLRRYSAFGHHISGTAKMGRPTDPMAVVDSECRVIGVDGLRVCDASVFPEIPSYNTSRPSLPGGRSAWRNVDGRKWEGCRGCARRARDGIVG